LCSYAFLAGLAYRNIEVTQSDLDLYFGPVNATDQVEIVAKYREQANTPSHVSFKLVTVPTKDGTGTFAYGAFQKAVSWFWF